MPQYTTEEELKIINNDLDSWNILKEIDGVYLATHERVQIMAETLNRISEVIVETIREGADAAFRKEADRIIRKIAKTMYGKDEEKTSAEK